MTPDWQTNTVYFSDRLPNQFPISFRAMQAVLDGEKIPFRLLANTNDIWVRDFMPIQVRENQFVQFTYAPDYLVDVPERITTFDETFEKELGIKPVYQIIKIDGGNVISNSSHVILSNKIFTENDAIEKINLITQLEEILKAEVIAIPQQPYDVIGHSDGMMRFLDEKTLLVNDYKDWESETYREKLQKVLLNKGFRIIHCPYYWVNKKDKEGIPYAHGCYINYLRIGDVLLLPQFGNQKRDKDALRFFKQHFQGKVYPINCHALAKNGGVLNCVGWTIQMD